MAATANKNKAKHQSRLHTTQPIDWLLAWEKAAKAAGMNLSEWIGLNCNNALPESARKALSKRLRGRPKSLD